MLETNYKVGKQNGLEILWNKNGQKVGETNYKNGKKNGLDIGWDDNGRKNIELNWKDGKKNGLQTVWLENGREIQISYKDGYERASIKPPKSEKEAGDYAGMVFDKTNMTYRETMQEIVDYAESSVAPKKEEVVTKEKEFNVIQEIKSRCQTQMGEHGFAIVKACVDQDFEALHEIQLGTYMEKHEAITTRCIDQMIGHGWAIVKACADQDIEAEDALRKY